MIFVFSAFLLVSFFIIYAIPTSPFILKFTQLKSKVEAKSGVYIASSKQPVEARSLQGSGYSLSCSPTPLNIIDSMHHQVKPKALQRSSQKRKGVGLQ